MRKYILSLFCLILVTSSNATAFTGITGLRYGPNPFSLEDGGPGINVYSDEPISIDAVISNPVVGGYVVFYDNGNYIGMNEVNQCFSVGMHVISAGYGDKNGNTIDTTREIPFTIYQRPTTNVPEFPTISAPIAAILGLVMIIGRRKT